MELTPTLTRRLFVASIIMMIVAVSLSVFNTATVLSAPLRTSVGVPDTVGFEGFLAESNGQPIADGTYTMTFRVWDLAEAGEVEWDQTIASVQVTNGLYSVALGGTVDPFLPRTFDGDRWIGVTVDTLSPTEISPRTKVSSVPFALNADNANRIGGGEVEGMVAAFDGPCPEGWAEFAAAQGRVIVGVPINGELRGVVPGSIPLGNKEDRAHSHTVPSHTHSPGVPIVVEGSDGYGADPSVWGSQPSAASGVLTSSTITTSQIIPYIQLRYCKLGG